MSRATELADFLDENSYDNPLRIANDMREAAALLREQDEALTKIQADMEAMKALLDKWGKE